MSSHGTRDWVDIANAARELLDALPTVWQGSTEGQRLRTLLDTVDDSPGEHRTLWAGPSREQVAEAVRWVVTHVCGDPLDDRFSRVIHERLAVPCEHRTLWEGETRAQYRGSADSYIAPPALPVPPGTRVRVVER